MQLSAILRILPADAPASAVSRQAVRRRQEYDRPCALGLCGSHAACKAIQRICGRLFRPQDSADHLFLRILYLFHRLRRSRHSADVRHRAHPPRHSFRRHHGGKQHRSHRRAPLLAPQRRVRFLRTEQQHRHGCGTERRNLHLPRYRQLHAALLAFADTGVRRILLRHQSEASDTREGACQAGAQPRPLFSGACVAACHKHQLLWSLLGSNEQLCGHLRQDAALASPTVPEYSSCFFRPD